jgi:hypothetical protein
LEETNLVESTWSQRSNTPRLEYPSWISGISDKIGLLAQRTLERKIDTVQNGLTNLASKQIGKVENGVFNFASAVESRVDNLLKETESPDWPIKNVQPTAYTAAQPQVQGSAKVSLNPPMQAPIVAQTFSNAIPVPVIGSQVPASAPQRYFLFRRISPAHFHNFFFF